MSSSRKPPIDTDAGAGADADPPPIPVTQPVLARVSPHTMVAGPGDTDRAATDEPEPQPVPPDGGDERRPEVTRRRRRRRRWPHRVVWLLLILLAAYSSRSLWLGPLVARVLEGKLSETLGTPVTIRVVEGTGFTSLRLIGVATRGVGHATPVRRLDVRALRLTWSPRRLLAGRDDWLETIEADGVNVELDASWTLRRRDRPLLNQLEIPDWLPLTRATDARIRLVGGDGGDEPGDELRIERVSFELRPAGPASSQLDLRAEAVVGTLDGQPLPARPARLAAVRVGNVVHIDRLELGNETLTRSLRFTIGEDRASLRVTGRVHAAGGWLYADATLRHGPGGRGHMLDCERLQFERMDLARLRKLPGLGGLPLPAGVMVGTVQGRIDIDDPTASALGFRVTSSQMRIEPARLGFAGVRPEVAVHLDTLASSGRFVRRVLQLEELRATAGDAVLEAGGLGFGYHPVAGIEPLAVDGQVRLDLTIPDAAALWRHVDGIGKRSGDAPEDVALAVLLEPTRRGLRTRVAYADGDGGRVAAEGTLDVQRQSSPLGAGRGRTHERPRSARPEPLEGYAMRIAESPARLAGSIDLPDLPRARNLLARLGVVVDALDGMTGHLHGTFELGASLAHPDLRLKLAGTDWRLRGEPVGNWHLEGRYTDEGSNRRARRALALDRLELTGGTDGGRPVDRIRASGRVDFDPLRIRHAWLDATIADLSRYGWLVQLFAPGPADGAMLGGSLQASLAASGPGDDWAGDLWLEARNLRVFGLSVADLAIDGTLGPSALELHRLASNGHTGALHLTGRVDWTDVDADGGRIDLGLDNVRFRRRDDTWRLDSPTTVQLEVAPWRPALAPDDSPASMHVCGLAIKRPLTLEGSLGRVQVQGELALATGISDFTVVGEQLALAPMVRLAAPGLTRMPVSGRIDRLDVAITGERRETLWDVKLETTGLDVIGADVVQQLVHWGEPDTVAPRPSPRMQMDASVWLAGVGGDMQIRDCRAAFHLPADRPRRVPDQPLTEPAPVAEIVIGGEGPLDPLSLLAPVPLSGHTAAAASPRGRMTWLEQLLSFGDLAWHARLDIPDCSELRRINEWLPAPVGSVRVRAGLSGTWRRPHLALRAQAPSLDFSGIDVAALDRGLGTQFAEQVGRFARLRQVGFGLQARYLIREAGEGAGRLGELRLDELLVSLGDELGHGVISGALQMRGTPLAVVAGREPVDALDARLSVNAVLPTLDRLPLPMGGPTRLSGAIAINVDAVSLLHRPLLRGRMAITDGTIEPPGSLPPIRDINVALILGDLLRDENGTVMPDDAGDPVLVFGETVTLQHPDEPLHRPGLPARGTDEFDRIKQRPHNATLGAAPVWFAGSIQLAPDPDRVALDLRLTGDELLLMRDTGVNLRGNAWLHLAGTLNDLELSGRVVEGEDGVRKPSGLELTGGLVRRHIDALDLLQPHTRGLRLTGIDVPFLRRARVDLAINYRQSANTDDGGPANGAGSGTNGYGATPDDGRIRLESNVADGKIGLDLRLLGTLGEPRLSGAVRVDDMFVSLPAAMLRITEGAMQFSETDGGRPILNIAGQTTVRGYRIDLRVLGPVTDPQLTVSSTPPLPADELLGMLVYGASPPTVDTLRGADLSGAEKVTVFVGADLLERVFGSRPELREQVLERIDVQPDVGASESGENMFVVRFVLGAFGEADRPGSPVQQRSDNNVAVELSRDRWDDYNAGLTFTIRFR